MKVEIFNIKETLDAVVALEAHKLFVALDKDIDSSDTELSEYVDVIITCDGITVNDDRISIEFPNGLIADYEICSDDYHYIEIL